MIGCFYQYTFLLLDKGRFLWEGYKMSSDFFVFSKVNEAAERGDAQAQFELGKYYLEVLCNYPKAFEWLKKSAEQGNAQGQYGLGMCYYDGPGVEQNNFEAIKWLKKSAEQGLIDAQFNLGVYLFRRKRFH